MLDPTLIRPYTAAEGAAAMDALMAESFEDVCRRIGRGIHRATERNCGVSLTRDEAAVASTVLLWYAAGVVPVSRDDLRVLFDGTLRSVSPHPQVFAGFPGYVLDQSTYRALSRAAAAALGDVELPEWMREHAKREGWTT
jgi:hypothetical protein